jgi:hypothetical protein
VLPTYQGWRGDGESPATMGKALANTRIFQIHIDTMRPEFFGLP